VPALGSLVMHKSSAARAAHREVLALGSLAPLRSSAARAALREALVLGSLAPLRSSAARAALREALALGSLAPLRSSAARAALRGASPLPHLLQRAMACEAIVASLVSTTRCFGWRGRRSACLQPCAKADNHGLTGTARCNKCGSGLAPRSAARAALDLQGAKDLKASASRSAARAALDLCITKDPKAGTPTPTPHTKKRGPQAPSRKTGLALTPFRLCAAP